MYKNIYSHFLRAIADEMERNDITNLSFIREFYIRPLQEGRILKHIEVAHLLQVSPAAITMMVARGDIQTTNDGKITEYYLCQYLSDKRKTAEEAKLRKAQKVSMTARMKDVAKSVNEYEQSNNICMKP